VSAGAVRAGDLVVNDRVVWGGGAVARVAMVVRAPGGLVEVVAEVGSDEAWSVVRVDPDATMQRATD
jgi:hypothetical protein